MEESDSKKIKSPEKTVKVACNLPLSGALETYGNHIREGVLFALQENEILLDKSPIQFVWGDNQSNPSKAKEILNNQLSDSPDIYICGLKPQTIAVDPEISKVDVPYFKWIFDVSVRPNGERNNFRTYLNYRVEPQLFLDYAKEISAERVVILYADLPHHEEEYEAIVIPGLRSMGIKDIIVERYPMQTLKFDSILYQLKQSRPDLIILNGYEMNLVPLVKALRAKEMIKEGNVVATYDMLDAAPLLSSDELEGIIVSAPKFVIRQKNNLNMEAWVSRFEKKYGKKPLYTHAFAYDMSTILLNVASKLQPNASAIEWVEALEAIRLDGITGPLWFNNFGDLPVNVELGVYRDGLLVPISNSEENEISIKAVSA